VLRRAQHQWTQTDQRDVDERGKRTAHRPEGAAPRSAGLLGLPHHHCFDQRPWRQPFVAVLSASQSCLALDFCPAHFGCHLLCHVRANAGQSFRKCPSRLERLCSLPRTYCAIPAHLRRSRQLANQHSRVSPLARWSRRADGRRPRPGERPTCVCIWHAHHSRGDPP
jgi:hypothetical protein